VIKLRRMRRTVPVARKEMHTQFWSENPNRRDYSEDLGVDGMMMMMMMMDIREMEWEGVVWTGFIWLRTDGDPMAGSCEYGYETSGSMKSGRLLTSQEGLCSMELLTTI
jgi:hypothetical protein